MQGLSSSTHRETYGHANYRRSIRHNNSNWINSRFFLSICFIPREKVESLGFAPTIFSRWMIPERWGDVFNQRNYVEWATEELKKLENTKKDSQKEAFG